MHIDARKMDNVAELKTDEVRAVGFVKPDGLIKVYDT
jgi:hypothetical protein